MVPVTGTAYRRGILFRAPAGEAFGCVLGYWSKKYKSLHIICYITG